MPEFDGEIRIKAEIDDKDIESGIKKIRSEIEILSDRIRTQTNLLSMMKQKYADIANGIVKSSEQIKLESGLEKSLSQIDKLSSKLSFLKKTMSYDLGDFVKFGIPVPKDLKSYRNNAETQINELNIKIKELQDKIPYISKRLSEVRLNPKVSEDMVRLGNAINTTENTLRRLVNKYAELNNKSISNKNVITKLEPIKTSIMSLGKESSFVGNSFKRVFSGMSNIFSGLLSPIQGVISGLSNIGTRILTIGSYVFIFQVFSKLLHGVRDILYSTTKADEGFAKSLNQIKSNLLTAFYPIYERILPILKTFMVYLAQATEFVAKFVAMLFGKTLKQSQEGAKRLYDIMQAPKTSSGSNAIEKDTENKEKNKVATDKLGKSYDDLKKKTNKNKSELFAFDKLITLTTLDMDKANKKVKQPKSPKIKEPSFLFMPTSSYITEDMIKGTLNIFDKFKYKLKPMLESAKELGDTIKTKLGKFSENAIKDFTTEFAKPLSDYFITKFMPNIFKSTTKMINNIDWDNLNSSLKKLWKSLEPFSENVGNGLLWFYENVLTKLGAYTFNVLLPQGLELLSNSINILNSVLEGVGDTFKWFFNEVIVPNANKVGKGINELLKDLNIQLDNLSGKKESIKWIGKIAGYMLLMVSPLGTVTAGIIGLSKLTDAYLALKEAVRKLCDELDRLKTFDVFKRIGSGISSLWNEGRQRIGHWIVDRSSQYIRPTYSMQRQNALSSWLRRGRYPGLAQGSVLRGGNPFLAYLNDQPRGQTNIETPLNTMIEAFETALSRNNYLSNNNTVVPNITIEANGDIGQLVSFLNLKLKQENQRIGNNFITGDVLI